MVNSARSTRHPGQRFAAVLVLCAGMCCAQAETIESRVAAVRGHIDSKNFTELYKLLNTTDDLPGIWGEADSNGYDWAFYSHFLRAEALAAQTKPVDALDEYRIALWQPTEAVITNRPIPYAKALAGLGRQLMLLTRNSDAQDIFRSVLALAENTQVKADIHWCRSSSAMRVEDMKTLAKEAHACIETAPFYNSKAYKYAALADFVLKNRSKAIDTWLDGLNAFVCALPVQDVEQYLLSALPYWTPISDDRIVTYYETLESIILANPISKENCSAITFLLRERVKLETLLPELCYGDDAQSLLTQACALGFQHDTEPDEWLPRTNAVCTVNPTLMETNHIENLINEAFWLERAYRNFNKSKAKYDDLLESRKALETSNVRIEGYTPLFFVLSHRARVQNKVDASSTESLELSVKLSNEAIDLVVSNRAGTGVFDCPEEFFLLLFYKSQYENQLDKQDDSIETIRWAGDIYPESSCIKCGIAIWEFNVADGDDKFEKMEKLIAQPDIKPPEKHWRKSASLRLHKVTDVAGDARRQCQRMARETLFEGLENAIFDFFGPSLLSTTVTERELEAIPLFTMLLRCSAGGLWGEFDKKDYPRVYSWLRRFGVTIPARKNMAPTIADALKWRRRFSAVDRNYPIDLTINADLSLWRAKDEPVLWSDVLDEPVAMRKQSATTDVWTATVTVPPHIFLVRYQFYKSLEDVPRAPDKHDVKRVFLVDNGHKAMTVSAIADRDIPLYIAIQCDAGSETVSNCIYTVATLYGALDEQALIPMHDDGTHGDITANDDVWTCLAEVKPRVRRMFYVFMIDEGVKTECITDEPEPLVRRYDVPQLDTGTNYVKHLFGKKGAVE